MSIRAKNAWGLIVSPHQTQNLTEQISNELLIIPSSSTPSWGSVFNLDMREKNVIIQDMMIQFNVGAVTGLSSDTSGYWSPFIYAIDHIEVIIGGVIADSLYPDEQFLRANIFATDAERALWNNGVGLYSSLSSRQTLGSTNNFYVNLNCLFNQSVFHQTQNSPDIQLRVYMDQITNALTSTPATGTPSATINYANLLVKIARPSSEMNHQSMMNLQKYGMLHQMYHSVLHQIYSVNSGVSNANIILSGITGRITMLFFVLRPTSGVNNDGSFTFTQITNFQLQSSGGTSLCGGQPISDSLYRDVLAKNWSDSTYLLDTSHGSYAYMWVFSSDIKTAVKTGTCLGNYPFTGSEQLQINFTGSLGSAYQIDIYAYQETVLELTPNVVRKLYVNV